MTGAPRVAFFRPDDERREAAEEIVSAVGGEPVPDPMLAIEPTGETPRADADYYIFTSVTAAEVLEADALAFNEAVVCAIGEATARALRGIGIDVDRVPERASSAGLVDALEPEVGGTRVEIARSDAGSDVLPDGLNAAGAYVHETVLYTLTRPPGAGRSVEELVAGTLDTLLFTSTLTVEHFLATAAERSQEDEVYQALDRVLVGAIGPPTARTLERECIEVDLIASESSFEALAREAMAAL